EEWHHRPKSGIILYSSMNPFRQFPEEWHHPPYSSMNLRANFLKSGIILLFFHEPRQFPEELASSSYSSMNPFRRIS
ncbi:hypothetical protein CDAR_623051, partial [Caerostris darwini]